MGAKSKAKKSPFDTAMNFLGWTGDGPRLLRAAFDNMEIAEEELARRRIKGALPEGVFVALRTPPSFDNLTVDWLYRSHVAELCDRLKAEGVQSGKMKADALVPATRAEVLVAMLEVSKMTPLNQSGQGLVELLWRDVAPPKVRNQGPGELKQMREKWDGHLEEELAKARNTCRAEWRRLEKTKEKQ